MIIAIPSVLLVIAAYNSSPMPIYMFVIRVCPGYPGNYLDRLISQRNDSMGCPINDQCYLLNILKGRLQTLV